MTTKLALTVLIGSAVLALASFCGAGEETSYTQTIWLDKDQQSAVFLPEGVLKDAEVAALPMSIGSVDVLRWQVEKFRSENNNHCNRPQDTAEQGVADNVQTIDELLSGTEAVFVGTIVDVVNGWSPWTNEISQMAYLSVDSLLMGDSPSEGETVGILFQGGRTVVSGTVICADPIEGLYVPTLGERLVVGGHPWDADPRFFNAGPRFPVVGDEVLAQPYRSLDKSEVARPLELLGRQIIAREKTRDQQ